MPTLSVAFLMLIEPLSILAIAAFTFALSSGALSVFFFFLQGKTISYVLKKNRTLSIEVGETSHPPYLPNCWEVLESDCIIGKYNPFFLKPSQVT